jgi:hypothetical protein
MNKWLDRYQDVRQVVPISDNTSYRKPIVPISKQELFNKDKKSTIKLNNQIFANNTREKVLENRRNFYFPYETEQTKNIRNLADDQVFKSSGDLISAIHPVGAVINALYQGPDLTLPLELSRFLPSKIGARGYDNFIPGFKIVSKVIDPIQMADKLHTADSLYNSADSIDLYNQFKNGGLVSKNSLNRNVTCSNCGWSWKLSDGGLDPMTCHKCGGDIKMKHGGELDEYEIKGEYRGQVPTSDVMQNRVPIGMQQIPTDPFTGQPLTREQISRFTPSFNTQQPVISQGTWKGNRTTKDNSFDPYSRIIEQDPQSEANVGKRMRKDFITKKVPAGVTAAAAIMAAPLAAPIVSSAMSAPLTIGSTILPYVTPATLIGAGFGLTGANKFANDLQSGYYLNPKISKSEKIFTGLTTGLDMLGTPGAVEAIGSHLIAPAYKGALKAGKYLTEETALKNAYKLNPQAIKENPEMFLYRAEPSNFNSQSTIDFMKQEIAAGRGKPWYKGTIRSYEEGHPKIMAQNDFHGQWFEKDPNRLDFYLNSGDKYDVGTPMDIIRKKIPTSEASNFSVANNAQANVISASPNTEFVLPRNIVNSAERFPQNSWQQLIQEDKAFNTPHWLKGYGKKSNLKLTRDYNLVKNSFPNSLSKMKTYDDVKEAFLKINGDADIVDLANLKGKYIYNSEKLPDNLNEIFRLDSMKNLEKQQSLNNLKNHLKMLVKQEGLDMNAYNKSIDDLDESILKFNDKDKHKLFLEKSLQIADEFYRHMYTQEIQQKLKNFSDEYGIDLINELKKHKSVFDKNKESMIRLNYNLPKHVFGSYGTDFNLAFDKNSNFPMYESNRINLNPNLINDLEQTKKTIWHELSHSYNRKLKKSEKFKKEISDILYGDVSSIPETNVNNTWIRELKDAGIEDYANEHIGYLNNPEEVWSHLSTNLRQELKNNNLISDYTDDITVEHLDKLANLKNSNVSEYFPLIKDKKNLVKLINKMTLGFIPIGVAGAALQQQKNGGPIVTNRGQWLDKYKDRGEVLTPAQQVALANSLAKNPKRITTPAPIVPAIRQGYAPTPYSEALRNQRNNEYARHKAMQNSDLAKTFASFTPGGDNVDAGVIGAETFANLNPVMSGPILSASRLAPAIMHPTNNAYWGADRSIGENALGVLGAAGDVAMLIPYFKGTLPKIPRGLPRVLSEGQPYEGAPHIYEDMVPINGRYQPRTVITDAGVKNEILGLEATPIIPLNQIEYPVTPNKFLYGPHSSFGKMEKGVVNNGNKTTQQSIFRNLGIDINKIDKDKNLFKNKFSNSTSKGLSLDAITNPNDYSPIGINVQNKIDPLHYDKLWYNVDLADYMNNPLHPDIKTDIRLGVENLYKNYFKPFKASKELGKQQFGGSMIKGAVTNTGYKNDSKDRYNDYNIIPSNNITMKNVNHPVIGIDNTGHTKMMHPGMNYTFPGQYVTEYPMMQHGGEMIKRADGSYSKRGLWDNIRDNRGSGKAPTKQMLDQEKKIRNQYKDGGEKDKFNTNLKGNAIEGFKYHSELFPSLLNDAFDYDTKGFYKQIYNEYNGDLDAITKALTPNSPTQHIGTDRYKKPNHPTFSNESKYSIPIIRPGGKWGHNEEENYDYFKATRRNIKNMNNSDGSPFNYFKRAEDYNQDGIPDVKLFFRNEPVFKQGGSVTLNTGGEQHRIYVKSTNRGEGDKGHIMVNHPTMDKGMWDTIDLTQKAGAKTIAQGVAATKEWHRENPYMKQIGGERNNNLKNINLNLPVIRHQEMNPLHFNGFLANDRNENLFIGGINPRYQNEDFSVGPYMIGVGNKYFQKFPADMGMSGTYHVNDNFDINMGVGQNNVNAGIKYNFANGGLTKYQNKGEVKFNPYENANRVSSNDGTKVFRLNANQVENAKKEQAVRASVEQKFLNNIKIKAAEERKRLAAKKLLPSDLRNMGQIMRQENYIKRAEGPKAKQPYAIVDKIGNVIRYYDVNHNMVKEENVITGESNKDVDKELSWDEFMRVHPTANKNAYIDYLQATNNKTTPSGLFKLHYKDDVLENPSTKGKIADMIIPGHRQKTIDARSHTYGNSGKMFTFTSQYGIPSSKAIHGTGYEDRLAAFTNGTDRNLSNGCINVNGKTICFDFLKENSNLYILPEEQGANNIVTFKPTLSSNSGRIDPTRNISRERVNEIRQTKKNFNNINKAANLGMNDRELNFATSVAEKESKGGRSIGSKMESNLLPGTIASSYGKFEMKEGFPWLKGGNPNNDTVALKAVRDFYREKNSDNFEHSDNFSDEIFNDEDINNARMYTEYNTGKSNPDGIWGEDYLKNLYPLTRYKNGGYVVRRSHDRKGKTHVVTGPDGTKKYFGDPNMGERGKSKYGKEAFYARHKSNLAKNPYFRAYARATWKEGGETMAIGGQTMMNPVTRKDNRNWLEFLKN